jgi:fructose-bisphosphate aldolase class II
MDYGYNVGVTRVVDMAMRAACGRRRTRLPRQSRNRDGWRRRRRWARRVVVEEMLLTDPKSSELRQKTHVDTLAIAIGTSHGAYKSRPPTGEVLAIDRIKEINARIRTRTSSCTVHRRCRRTCSS